MICDVKLIEPESGKILADHIEVADHFFSRFAGLQLRSGLAAGHGLVLVPCGAIHTCFMRFPIDVLMLDKNGKITAVRESLTPWRMMNAPRATHAVLELPAGRAGGVECGKRLKLCTEKGKSIPPALRFLVEGK